MTKDEINEKVLECAKYYVENNSTVRDIAKIYNISKSQVHNYLRFNLKKLDETLYNKVKIVSDKNKKERHVRGGLATKRKYESLKTPKN